MVDANLENRVDALLHGAIDMHCHTGPSIMKRKLDHLEQIEDAERAGLRAVLFKDHFYSDTGVLEVIRKHRPAESRLLLLSGVPLNNALGGFNPYAVRHGLGRGARLVWMPTLCACNHLTSAFRYDLAGRLGMIRPKGLTAINARGEVIDELKVIFDIIAEHDAILCGGHLHATEMFPLFAEAKRRGVRRLLVSHPTFWIEADLQDLRDLTSMGVYLEHVACLTIDCVDRLYTADELRSFIDTGGIDRTILSSDLGQPQNPRPVEGFRSVIKLCIEAGYSDSDIRKLTSRNAATLIGLDEAAA